MALFAGRAAGSLARESREWKKLWMQEEQAEQQYHLAQKQMDHQVQLQTDQQAFQIRRDEAQNAFNEGLLDRKELLQVSEMALDLMPSMPVDQQWEQVEYLEQMGSPLAQAARGIVRRGMFDNPAQAMAMVDSLFSADIGTPFTPEFVRMAAQTVVGISGMEGEAATNFMDGVERALTERGEEREEWNKLAWERERTAVRQAQADVTHRESETRHVDADTERIFQGIAVTEEQRKDVLESLRLSNVALRTDNAQQQIINNILPAQLSAELGNILANTKGIENQNRLFDATFDAMVQQVMDEASITRENARHLVATGAFRDAAVKGDVDLMKATIAKTYSEVDFLDTQTEALNLSMQEARIAMATSLVEEGRGDLIAGFADDLFGDLGMSTEQQAALVESLRETADSNLRHRDKGIQANTRIAMANADLKELEADTAEYRQQFEDKVTLRELGQRDRQLDLTEDEMIASLELSRDRLTLDAEALGHDVNLRKRALEIQERGVDADIAYNVAYLELQAGRLDLDIEALEQDVDLRTRALDLQETGMDREEAYNQAYLELLHERLGLDQWIAEDVSERGWEGLAIESRRVSAFGASVIQDFDGELPTSGETHKAIFDSLRISTGDLLRAADTVNEHGVALRQLESIIDIDPDSGEILGWRDPEKESDNRARLSALARRYGIDLLGGESMEDVALELQQLITTDQEAARLNAQNNTMAYVREWYSIQRTIPTAQQLGFPPNHPIYLAAVQRIPGVYAQGAINSHALGRANSLAERVVTSMLENGEGSAAVTVAWDELQDEFTYEELEHAGIPTFIEFSAITNEVMEDYRQDMNTAERMAGLMGQMWGDEYDLKNEADRYELNTRLGAVYNSIHGTTSQDGQVLDKGLLGRLSDLPAGGRPAAGAHQARQEVSRYAHSVINLFGAENIQEGLIEVSPWDGQATIPDPAALAEWLVNVSHGVADGRRALDIVDGFERTR